MHSRDELFLHSLKCYFGVYFPRCVATQEKNTQIILEIMSTETVHHWSRYIILYLAWALIQHQDAVLPVFSAANLALASEWVIKFNSLSGDSRQQGPYSPYKLCNHSLYIGIIIFPHIDNTQSTGHN